MLAGGARDAGLGHWRCWLVLAGGARDAGWGALDMLDAVWGGA